MAKSLSEKRRIVRGLFVANTLVEEDRHGNFKFTKDGEEYRYHFKTNIIRLEFKSTSGWWLIIESFPISNIYKDPGILNLP